MSDLPGLARRWREAFEARRECEEAIAVLKKCEADIKGRIMEWLAASGQRGASIPGVGTLTVTERRTVIITDGELAARTELESLKDMEARGLPLVNGTLLQQRAAQNKLLAMIEDRIGRDAGREPAADEIDRELRAMGFGMLTQPDLHFAAPRKAAA